MKRDRRQILTEYLVLRAQGGSERAFRQLYDLWEAPVRSFSRTRLGDVEAAAEVAQRVWVNIARGLHGLEDPACFPKWAYQIVARRAADWIRRETRARRRRKAIEAEPERVFPAGGATAAESSAALDLRDAIARLSDGHREILELFYLREMEVAAIAELLGIPSGTVKSRLFSARAGLKEVILNSSTYDQRRESI